MRKGDLILMVIVVLALVVVAWNKLGPSSEEYRPLIRFSTPTPPPDSIPPGPGLSAIVLVGPEERRPTFCVDLRTPGIVKLPYEELMVRTPNSEVKIRLRVGAGGQVNFHPRNDVRGSGLARRLIVQAIKSWRFTPYKTGEILYYFHLGSKGRKLTIEPHLKKLPQYLEWPISDGKLYFGFPDHLVDKKGQVIW